MTQAFRYEMDKRGVVEILKSAPVKAELESLAEKKTAEANRLLARHGRSDGEHVYAHDAKNLTFTAVETVHTTGDATEGDQHRHHTLNAVNH